MTKSGLAEPWDRFGEPDACRRIASGNYDRAITATAR